MLCGLLRPTSGTRRRRRRRRRDSDPEAVKRRIGYMSQRFSLYELLTVDQNIQFFGGIYGLRGERLAARRQFVLDMAGLHRTRGHPDTRSRRRLAAAPRARLRHPARAADRVPRRAHRRRRSAVAPSVLGSHRPHVRRRRHRPRHHALHGRSRALPSHRHHPGRQARRPRHHHRAEAGVSRPPDPRGPGRATRRRDGSARRASPTSRRPACSAPRCTWCCAAPITRKR